MTAADRDYLLCLAEMLCRAPSAVHGTPAPDCVSSGGCSWTRRRRVRAHEVSEMIFTARTDSVTEG